MQEKIPNVTTATVTDETSMDVAARNAFKSFSPEQIEIAMRLLKDNFIANVGLWRALDYNQKQLFPLGVVAALDKALLISEDTGVPPTDEKKLQQYLQAALKPSVLSSAEKLQILHALVTAKAPPDTQPAFEFKDFVHREQATAVATTAAKNNFDAYERNKTTGTKKQEHSFIIVPGGSGSGKTRAACEIANILQHSSALPVVFAHTQMIYVEFNNGNAIGTASENTVPSDMLGLRLFLKAFRNEKLSSNTLAGMLSELSKKKVFEFPLVMHMISQYYHKWLHLDSSITLPIVIVLDEFQRTMDALGEGKKWKLIANALGNYMCEIDAVNQRLHQDNLLVIPVLAGTVIKDISFELTEYNNQVVNLPMFPLPIVHKLALEAGLPTHVLQGREKARFWLLMGLVPRSLEYAVQCAQMLLEKPQFQGKQLVGYDDQLFTEALFTTVEQLLRSKYLLSSNDITNSMENDELLLLMTAIGVRISTHEKWINQLEQQGRIYLDEHRRVFLPYIVFASLQNKFLERLPKALLPELSSSFTWKMFEMLDTTLLALRLNYYDEIHCKKVLVRDLWPGAHCSNQLKILSLKVVDVTVGNETTPFVSQHDGIVTINKDSPVILDSCNPPVPLPRKEWTDFILRAPKNHARIDARWFTKTSKNKPVLVVIQYKYMEAPNLPEAKEDQLSENPLRWYNSIIPLLQSEYANHHVIGVFITNGNIPMKAKHAIDEHPNNLIVIEGSVIAQYYSPNILPYVQTMEPKMVQ